MQALNKYQRTLGKKQMATRLSPQDVGKHAIVVGDPARVLWVAEQLEDAGEVAYSREFLTWKGTYRGMQITATSHGVGCPGAALVIEELASIGITHVIRVGSTAALQPGMRIGDLVINTGAMRNDGTTRFHVDDGFPALPNHFLCQTLIEVALELRESYGYRLFVGPNSCDDSFYGETPEWIEKLSRKHKLLNVEMESSAIFTLGYLRGIKTAMICAVSANLVTSDYEYEGESEKLAQSWDHEITIALEAIYRFDQGKTLATQVDHAEVEWNFPHRG